MTSLNMLWVFLILGWLAAFILVWLWQQGQQQVKAQAFAHQQAQQHNEQLRLLADNQYQQLEQQLKQLQLTHQQLTEAHQQAQAQSTRLQTELELTQSQHIAWQHQLNQQWEEKFERLSQRSLEAMHTKLSAQAEENYQARQTLLNKDVQQLLAPIQELLKVQETKVLALSEQTIRETTSLKEQLLHSFEQTKALSAAKDRIVSVLTDSKGRGDWGELQLQKLLETSGLVQGLNYEWQPVQSNSSRPDVQINLPNGHVIFIDVKTLIGTLERLEQEADTPELQQKLVDSLRSEITRLTKRAYNQQHHRSVDFVVLYVPRESMLRTPLMMDPNLLEDAFRQNIILASPLILMAMLKTVAQGWAQAQVSENAREVQRMGSELHKRMAIFAEHFLKMGSVLDKATKQYDEAAASFRRNLTPQVKRLEKLGASSSKTLPDDLGELDTDFDPLPSEKTSDSESALSELKFNSV